MHSKRAGQTVRLGHERQPAVGLYDPNVMFIDFGWRTRGGVLLDEDHLASGSTSSKSSSEPNASSGDRREDITLGSIQDEIAGFKVDRPRGRLETVSDRVGLGQRVARCLNPRTGRADPMQGGISVSDAYRTDRGTLGGLVKDRENGDPMILSNFHVLAGTWYARPGWPICQPGRGDGGSRADTVATLSRHAMASNLDAAVARTHRQPPTRQRSVGAGAGDRRELGANGDGGGQVRPNDRGHARARDGCRRDRQNALQWRLPSHPQRDED